MSAEEKNEEKNLEVAPAKEVSEENGGCELSIFEENKRGLLNISFIFALLCGGASLYLQDASVAIFCFGVYLVLRCNKLPPFLEEHGVKIFMVISALIVAIMGIAARVVMYAKCRSLWLDEALFAESIVARNWAELLASPLGNAQSAPVLYVVAVKVFGSVLGYSEFSLRLFSLLSFFGLLICEWFFLRKALRIDRVKTAFVLILTAVVPSFVYYSNEVKPYMGDAFFIILTFLLYAFYIQNKVSLAKLTVFYVLILGFCTPAIFFIGGILAAEFLTAVLARDGKRALYVSMSGLLMVVLFGLYYYWWMRPVQKVMDDFWNGSHDKSCFNAFFIVLVNLLYFLYTLRSREKSSLVVLTVSYVLILGFCPPAIFFVGGVLAGELLAAVFAADKRRIKLILTSVLSIAAVFWLVLPWTSSVPEAMNDFWNNPEGKTRLINDIKNIFSSFPFLGFDSTLIWALVPFALLGIYSLIKRKSRIAYSVVASMFLVCLASSIGKWPLSGRLWLFLPAVVLVFSAVGHDFISKSGNIVIRRTVFCLFSAITVFYFICGMTQFKDGVYRNNQEANPLIQYVKEHIKSDEFLYVYPSAIPTLKFRNGYATGTIGRTGGDNIIYGINRNEWNENKLGAELEAVIKSRKAYMLFQHCWFGINPGLAALREYGTVTTVLNYHNTLLFYFEARE